MVSDTSPAAQAHLDALYRNMTVAAKVRRMLGLSELTHLLAAHELARQHPDEDATQLRLRVAARCWEPELLARYLAWRRAR